MNPEQLKGLIRWVLTSVSGIALGWLAATKALTPEQLQQVGSFMSSEAVVSIVVAIGTLVWSLLTHTPTGMVKSAAKLDEVEKIEMKSTPEGVKIKDRVGSSPEATITIAPKIV